VSDCEFADIQGPLHFHGCDPGYPPAINASIRLIGRSPIADYTCLAAHFFQKIPHPMTLSALTLQNILFCWIACVAVAAIAEMCSDECSAAAVHVRYMQIVRASFGLDCGPA
jgi:hypothetical protein